MALMRWRPMNELLRVQDQIDRLFDDFLSRTPERREAAWAPTVDISEAKDDFLVRAEVPGMTKDDIKITLRDNVLTLSGEKKREEEVKDENYHRIERSYGSFRRSFTLPSLVEADRISASYKNGVLTVKLPKSEKVKVKEIPITVE